MPRLVATLALLLSAAPGFAAGVEGQALGYTKPVVGRGLTLVVLGDPAAEEAVKDPAARKQFADLRTRYPRTGLYKGDALMWAVEDGVYAPYDNVHPAADGVHLVRVEGEWWRTKDFTGGRNRLSPEEEQKQLDAPAVSFFTDGKLVRRYAVRDVVVDPTQLQHTPKHLLWTTGGVLNDDTGRFLLLTHDSQRLLFDVTTGELVSRQAAGLGNPLVKPLLVVCAVLSLGVLGAWVYFVFVRKPAVPATGTGPAAGTTGSV